jgi:alkylated DNA repair dioxygenase AlkB
MGPATPLPLSLFAAGEPDVDAQAPVERHDLDGRSWFDLSRRWLAGGDDLMARLVDGMAWRQGTRRMWDREVAEPRLSTALALGGPATPAVVPRMASALSRRYGVRFDSCFVNYYRDGDDSVAWHADRDGRTQREPLVAIVSLGGPRGFALRPKGGGRSVRVTLHSGDLLVMGGAAQHEWEHAVPKVRAAPPRISLSFRHRPRPADRLSP